MSSRMRFEIGFGQMRRDRGVDREHEDSLCVLVLGNLSGHRFHSAGAADRLSSRQARNIDVDNFDDVFARIAPTLTLRDVRGLDPHVLNFGSLDDFHPDGLCRSIQACRELHASRARVLDPATRVAEAQRLTASLRVATDVSGPGANEDRDALLQRLIGAQPRDARVGSAPSGVVDRLVRQLLGPSGSSENGVAPEPYLNAIDGILSELLRAVLHDPAFQSLESAWRGLRRFVESVDLGQSLKLRVFDAGKDDLLRDLVQSGSDLRESEAYRAVSGALCGGADARPRTLLVGLYRLGATEQDISLLERLAELAALLRSPIIVDADAALAGCRSLDDDRDPRNWSLPDAALAARWHALRRGPQARWLGLSLPRVLNRLPYGARTEPIESFAFEEIPGDVVHEDLLWGSAALACAQALAAQALDGHVLTHGTGPMELDDLPAYTHEVDGETLLQPCAEYLLPSTIGEELSRRGMIPLMSYASRNTVRIAAVQSVAEPWSALGDFASAASGVDER